MPDKPWFLDFPKVQVNPEVPRGIIYVLPCRKQDETEEDWLKRCGVVRNVGMPPKRKRYYPSADPFVDPEKAAICENCDKNESLHDIDDYCPEPERLDGDINA